LKLKARGVLDQTLFEVKKYCINLILPTCRPANSSPTIYIYYTAPHGVCSTSMGPTFEKRSRLAWKHTEIRM